MSEYSDIRNLYHQIYLFNYVADLPAPKGGQIVIIKQTPDFGAAHIMLVTDGERTIRELYEAWKNTQVTPQAVMEAVIAERQGRISADAGLQQQITALRQAANRALVFENHAGLSAWMASGQPLPPPNLPYTQADLQIGWMALFRDTGVSDLWWDGNEWLEKEVTIDLSGYRTAAAQDAIDATHAPLNSPVFSGIPQVTVPDYTVPLQAAPVSELVYVLEAVTSLLRGKRRIFERGLSFRPAYRAFERNGVKRKTERASI